MMAPQLLAARATLRAPRALTSYALMRLDRPVASRRMPAQLTTARGWTSLAKASMRSVSPTESSVSVPTTW